MEEMVIDNRNISRFSKREYRSTPLAQRIVTRMKMIGKIAFYQFLVPNPWYAYVFDFYKMVSEKCDFNISSSKKLCYLHKISF